MTDTPSIPVDFHDDGLLWLINAVCLHPRGFALAHTPGDPAGDLRLYGDGTEPWRFASTADVIAQGGDATKAPDVDGLFAKVEAMLARARAGNV